MHECSDVDLNLWFHQIKGNTERNRVFNNETKYFVPRE